MKAWLLDNWWWVVLVAFFVIALIVDGHDEDSTASNGDTVPCYAVDLAACPGYGQP